jgi:membrane-associated protease RseP (regulator of RpoE activity)
MMQQRSHSSRSASLRSALLGSLVIATPVFGIEPPVDSRPIPPQRPPAPQTAPKAKPVRPGPVAADAAPSKSARPYLGVILDPVPDLLAEHLQLEPGRGVVVGDLVADGPAAGAGVSVGDVLVEVGGQPVGSPEAVRAALRDREVGDRVKVGFVHQGKLEQAEVELRAAPQAMAGGFKRADGEPLNGFLERLPNRQADLIREALERNLRAFEDLESDSGFGDPFQQGLMRRLQKEMGGLNMNFNAQSSIRLLDESGSVEMTSQDGRKEVRVFDESGNLVWEGPYDTDEDKAAAPPEVQRRLEKLDINMDLEGSGLKLRLGPSRFRSLDEIEDPPMTR